MLDNHKENDEGTSEAAELKGMGANDSCETIGVIQTRRVDREKDCRVKSRLVLEDFNRSQEMFSPIPSTLYLKTMLAASSHDRNNHPESDHVTIAMDVHTAFLHADVDEEVFAEPPESDEGYESELREDEVWKLNRALSGYRKAPKCGNNML